MNKNTFMNDERLDEIFDGLMGKITKPKLFTGKVDGNKIMILCPGFAQEDIYVGVENNTLTIEGESEEFGTFKDRYEISRDTVSVDISVKDGVLIATLTQKPSNVEITFSD